MNFMVNMMKLVNVKIHFLIIFRNQALQYTMPNTLEQHGIAENGTYSYEYG